MNKFIKLPLFLGSVYLVFCSSLSIVANLCIPQIARNEEKKRTESYKKAYANPVGDAQELKNVDFSAYSQINGIALVKHNENNGEVESYVYSLTTKDPQSGTCSFMLGLDKATGVIDGYYMMTNSNAGYADYYNDNAVVLEDLKADGQVTSAGITKTQKVVQECVDQAVAHYNATFGGNA